MSCAEADLTRRPQQVFDLDPHLLATLRPLSDPTCGPQVPVRGEPSKDQAPATACTICIRSFDDASEQRQHFRSDWHGYNARQHVRGQPALSEDDFERIVGDLDSSISGSDVSDEDDEFETDAVSSAVEAGAISDPKRTRATGSPLVLVASSLLPEDTFVAMYKVLLQTEKRESEDAVRYLCTKQLKDRVSIQSQNHHANPPGPSAHGGPLFFLCMIGGGHFAAMVVSPVATSGKQRFHAEQQPQVLAHKTFHRYTTRRKQGGAQSANDASKGNAHSAGAGIRRHNEMALQTEVRTLLHDWRDLIRSCELLFVRASGPANRRTLFGQHENPTLRGDDPRLRSFPFSTRRPIKRELLRAFQELVTIKFVRREQSTSPATANRPSREPTGVPNAPRPEQSRKISEQDEEALLHSTQLQALIKRNKAPRVVSYLQQNELTPSFVFYPPDAPSNHHAPTPLHLAARLGSAPVVSALLMKAAADPTLKTSEGRTPYDLASDRTTRDAFRVARFQLGEAPWDWNAAHCPAPLSQAQVDEHADSEKQEAQKLEAERREVEIHRIAASEQGASGPAKQGSKVSLVGHVKGADIREQEVRGLPPEMRAKVEREKRARAAEERLKRLALS